MASIRWLGVATCVFLLSSFAAAEDFARQGQQALEKNDPNQAIACFSKAIQANPKDAASYRGRGDAYLQLGKFDPALADLNEARHLEPRDAAILASCARLLLKIGRNREAIAEATASLQLDAKNAGAYGTRGLGSVWQMSRMFQVIQDKGDMNHSAVINGQFLVAGGDTPPLLEPTD